MKAGREERKGRKENDLTTTYSKPSTPATEASFSIAKSPVGICESAICNEEPCGKLQGIINHITTYNLR